VNEHQIFKDIMEVVTKYLQKCDFHKKVHADASISERYALDCFDSLTNVTSCIEQLNFCIEMLSGYRSELTPSEMNRHHYIVYGIENYYLRITSVYDRCLRLLNIVFQIGLPERECKNSTVLKNSHISETPVLNIMKDIDKFTGQFRQQRNTVAHSGQYTDSDGLGMIGSYYFLEAQGAEEIIKFKHIYKSQTDKYIAEKKEEFNKQLDELTKLVTKLFDVLIHFYNNKYESFV